MIPEIVLKTVLIGIAASIPVGPLAIYVFQSSVSRGRRAGLLSASGATISDTVYATFSVFAYSIIAGFIEQNIGIIQLAGGAIVAAVGVGMACSRSSAPESGPVKKSRIALDVSKSTLMGFANPGCLAWMLALFASFRVDVHAMPWYMTGVAIGGVAAGSILYWFLFCTAAARGSRTFKVATLLHINRISGYFVIAFGIWFIVRGIISLV